MTQCCDEGTLRAYLADPASLLPEDRKQIESHLTGCPTCRRSLESLRMLQSRVEAHMAALAPSSAPDIQLALQKMRRTLGEQKAIPPTITAPGLPLPVERQGQDAGGRKLMQTLSFARPSRRPALVSGLIAAMLIFSLVAFPSMRAAADEFLQSFRAKSLMFVPVDQSRIKEIMQATGNPTDLFLSPPEVVGNPQTIKVNSLDEASRLVSFSPELPGAFPSAPTSTGYTVREQARLQTQVNIANTRDLLKAMNINDVSLPDQLGTAPITADVPATLQTTYEGDGYHFTLLQGTTPTVNLPKGVELAQLGKAGLRLLGMEPGQASKLSSEIDWSSTLVVPFPTGLDNIVHVQVGDADGLMVNAPNELTGSYSGGRATFIYWQKGDRFFVLEGSGADITPDKVLVVAKSVK